jgi:hypothetical protein
VAMHTVCYLGRYKKVLQNFHQLLKVPFQVSESSVHHARREIMSNTLNKVSSRSKPAGEQDPTVLTMRQEDRLLKEFTASHWQSAVNLLARTFLSIPHGVR